MTHVTHCFALSLDSNNSSKFFTVEVVTFDGESHTMEVEAHNAEEAQDIAASRVDNVDYTMIQAVVD